MSEQRKHLAHLAPDDQRRLITPTETARLGTLSGAIGQAVPQRRQEVVRLFAGEGPDRIRRVVRLGGAQVLDDVGVHEPDAANVAEAFNCPLMLGG